MNTLDRLIESERLFQNWLKVSYELHQKSGSASKEFLQVGHPLAPTPYVKYSGFDYLFKRTIKTPAPFVGNYEAFAIVLIEFILDNVLALYGDSIRIAVNGTKSCAIYKDCGSEIGGFWCDLSREGNIYTVAVAYQIYRKDNSIMMDPRNFRSYTAGNIKQSDAYLASNKLRFFYTKRFIIFSIVALILGSIALGMITQQGSLLLVLLGFLFGMYTFAYIKNGFERWGNSEIAHERSAIEREATIRLVYDLSPIHMPVAYFSQEKVAEAIARNHDHQVFIERLSAVLEKAVLAGEQSD